MDDLNIKLQNLDINSKQQLGQFYTTNYKYILQNLYIPYNINNIIEPFAGNGDLIHNIKNKTIECYDIEPKQDYIVYRDTLLNPPEYNNKFVITNPPYLARNKSKSKVIFDRYNQNDLYKCFLSNLINDNCLGGILIIPLNFWCSIRKNDIDLRKQFLDIYNISYLNIFEEQVFDDTKYSICSFQFEKIKNNKNDSIKCTIYPINKEYEFIINNTNNYTIGGEIYNLKKNKNIKVERLTKKNNNSIYKTNILARCIDNNLNEVISLSVVDDNDIYVDNTEKLSARTFATLVIQPQISLDKQQLLVKKFNDYLTTQRKKYNSLFLTNYRESTDIARKRISFGLIFSIVNYLLNEINQELN